MRILKNWAQLLSVAVIVASLTGCAATQLAITKRNLAVSTKTSATIFLDPVPDYQKTVYVQVRNTSGTPFNIRPKLASQLRNRGYRVTTHLQQAHYMVQANVLKVSKMSETAAKKVMGSSFGSALAGGALGAGVGAIAGASGGSVAGIGLVTGTAAFLVDNMVKDVNYVAVVDVQISERSRSAVSERTRSRLSQGTHASTTQRYSDKTHWKRYRTRVVGRAEKVNLDYSQARYPLEHHVSAAIAGIF